MHLINCSHFQGEIMFSVFLHLPLNHPNFGIACSGQQELNCAVLLGRNQFWSYFDQKV